MKSKRFKTLLPHEVSTAPTSVRITVALDNILVTVRQNILAVSVLFQVLLPT
jgi:hypothetical protein